MRYPVLFCGIVFAFASPVFAKDGAIDSAAPVKAAMDYCLTPVRDGNDLAKIAREHGMIELPYEQAVKFSPDTGSVFMISESSGNAVLMTNKDNAGICSIAIREISTPAFWAAIDQSFNSKTGFMMMHEKRVEGHETTKREYRTGPKPITVLITASDRPRKGGMQALITVAKVKQ